jgi:hypothetical protein
MFGECHAHLFMNGYDYRKAVELHKGHICEEELRNSLAAYKEQGVSFIREGGDDLGVSLAVKKMASEYGIDYRTPVYAIHKNGHYGSIVGKGFDTIKEYESLVKQAKKEGADFIKIMVSGLVDFSNFGVITSTPLAKGEIREMIHIAHEEGMAVMVHGNGNETVREAAEAGADSLEHGRYIGEEALYAMAEAGCIWVPTVVTVSNLLGSGRFPDEVVEKIYTSDQENLRRGRKIGVQMALGSDAGAYRVPHGHGIAEEYQVFQKVFGPSKELDFFLKKGEEAIKKRFRRE